MVFLANFSQCVDVAWLLFIGLSTLCRKTYAFRVVRVCVRVCVCNAISRKPRIRFFWNFAQSCILMRVKKHSKRIFEKKSSPDYRGLVSKMGQKSTFFAISSKHHIRFWWNLAKSCGIWFVIIWHRAVCWENSWSGDNPLNPPENNRIKKTIGFRA